MQWVSINGVRQPAFKDIGGDFFNLSELLHSLMVRYIDNKTKWPRQVRELILDSRSQGLKVSRSQGLKVSRSQDLKVSRSQGLKEEGEDTP